MVKSVRNFFFFLKYALHFSPSTVEVDGTNKVHNIFRAW